MCIQASEDALLERAVIMNVAVLQNLHRGVLRDKELLQRKRAEFDLNRDHNP